MVIKNAETNQEELIRLCDHYSDSDDRAERESGYFLLANLPARHWVDDGGAGDIYQHYLDSLEHTQTALANHPKYLSRPAAQPGRAGRPKPKFIRDIDVVQAEPLIEATRLALDVWDDTPWAAGYPEALFREYVLPYRVSNEPLEYHWRQDAQGRYAGLLAADTATSVLEATKKVLPHITFQNYVLLYGNAPQSYSSMLRTNRGKCDDRCNLIAMTMRALGIPTAVDRIPLWGSINNGHAVNAVIFPDGTAKGYSERRDLDGRILLTRKVPKVWRETFSIQQGTALYKYREQEEIPLLFRNFNFVDVTASYEVPVADVTVDIPPDHRTHKLAWLGVFTLRGWEPIAWGGIRSGKARFSDMGTGYNAGQSPKHKGEDIGEGMLYLPGVFRKEALRPVGLPFILREDGSTVELRPDTAARRSVVLTRKYPRKERIVQFAERLRGAVIEGANRPDFSDAVPLYRIAKTPLSRTEEQPIGSGRRFRYVRFLKPSDGLSLGELAFYGPHDDRLAGRIIGDEFIRNEPDLTLIFDGNPLTYFDTPDLRNIWVGLDLGRPVEIARVAYCPRTDDNDVSPGDEYELFFWDDDWVSLGRQVAEGYSLTWDEVPANALLWLRNRTKGREERPFSYESGKQVWW